MFYFDTFEGKKILKSTLLPNVDCFFTTREFTLTPANREDLTEEANKNRELLEKNSNTKITTAKQIHSDNIQIIDNKKHYYEDTDALISNIPNSLLLMNFADCVPIILYSEEDNTGAIIHAGWRGTEKEITSKTIKKMTKELNINPKNITALIGPSIGKCCFETNKEVFDKLIRNKNENKFYEQRGQKYYIDLKLINNTQLINSGVVNIDICDYCTCCMSDIFFSYRKENGITARHSAILKIKEGK